MFRRLDPSDPAARARIAHNAAAFAIMVSLFLAVSSAAVAIWHPAVGLRIAGGLVACIALLYGAYNVFLYRRLASAGSVTTQLAARRTAVPDKRTTLFLLTAVLGLFILALGGKMHGAAGAWFAPGSNDGEALMLAAAGALTMIGAAVAIVWYGLRRRRDNNELS